MTADNIADHRQRFLAKLSECVDQKRANQTLLSRDLSNDYIQRLVDLENNPSITKTGRDYRLKNRYSVLEVVMDGESTQILQFANTNRRVAVLEDLFDVIHTAHRDKGHGGRDVLKHELADKYGNVTKEHINIYLSLCETCQLKKSKLRKGMVTRPIVSNDMNSRAQVPVCVIRLAHSALRIDLIDMQSQPDGDYRFIMVYQDHLTKIVRLEALRTKTAEEVAKVLLDVFCLFGAPHVLQSDNGREFANSVIRAIAAMWPECHIVHGKPRYSQSQGSVERANQDIEAILACWQKDNNTTQWSEGLRFVQWKKNTRLHSGIGRQHYEAMFGHKPRLGLSSLNMPQNLLNNVETEEQLQELLAIREPEEAQNTGGEDKAGTTNCVSCQQMVTTDTSCESCGRTCHDAVRCMPTALTCSHCCTRADIEGHRTAANATQRKQADRMMQKSVERFKPAELGDTVTLPIPEVDRGRAELRNAKAMVISVEGNGLYRLGTKHGVLNQAYSRNQFAPCIEKFIAEDEIDHSKQISLRELARMESLGSGQGFFKCSCKKSCQSGRCKCYKNKVKCNSKCHNSLTCNNKFDN